MISFYNQTLLLTSPELEKGDFYGEYAFVLNISRFQNDLVLCLLAYLTVKHVSNMYKTPG